MHKLPAIVAWVVRTVALTTTFSCAEEVTRHCYPVTGQSKSEKKCGIKKTQNASFNCPEGENWFGGPVDHLQCTGSKYYEQRVGYHAYSIGRRSSTSDLADDPTKKGIFVDGSELKQPAFVRCKHRVHGCHTNTTKIKGHCCAAKKPLNKQSFEKKYTCAAKLKSNTVTIRGLDPGKSRTVSVNCGADAFALWVTCEEKGLKQGKPQLSGGYAGGTTSTTSFGSSVNVKPECRLKNADMGPLGTGFLGSQYFGDLSIHAACCTPV